MKAREFCENLLAVMPTRAELEDYGLDEEDIESIEACFSAKKRDRVFDGDGSELERLVYEYDCSRVQVGLVRFLEEPIACSEGREIGSLEVDPIVVLGDCRVAVLDMLDRRRVQFICSLDSEGFLKALATYALQVRRQDDWKGKSDEAARQCCVAAGGNEYFSFWRVLCSF